MGKDYYKLLDLDRSNVDEDAIKKAYRKMALRWHPDRNPNNKIQSEAKFKEISEAYEVLSDAQKRKIYDQVGEEGLKNQPPPSSSSGFGTSGGMPGGGMPFTFAFGGAPQGQTGGFSPRDPRDIFSQFESMFGGMRGTNGDDEGGSSFAGGMPGFPGFSHAQSQSRAGGRGGGEKRKGPNLKHQLALSLEDLYEGVTKKIAITRNRIENGKLVQRKDEFEVVVKKGWKSGTKITFERQCDETLDGHEAGDFIIEISEKKHPRFTRAGSDLIHKRTLTLTEALCGTTISVIGIDGKKIELDLSEGGISPATKRVLKGQGMPKTKSPAERGDLIIEFDVLWPKTKLTSKQKDLIREANLPSQ